MSKLGTTILFFATLLLTVVGAYLGLNATSQPFAIHMAIFTLACAGFLVFVLRRAGKPI